MIKHNFASYGAKVLFQIIWEILYFPLWWYSAGAYRFGQKILGFLSYQQSSLGLYVWLKNLFVPMYGQHDIAGRLISFFIRVIQIIYRGAAVAIIFLACLGAMLAWLLLPPAIIVALFFQLL